MKPSRLQARLHKRHPDKGGCDIALFRKLKETFEKRRAFTLLSFKRKPDADVDNGLVVS
jgi:hypothetical protein